MAACGIGISSGKGAGDVALIQRVLLAFRIRGDADFGADRAAIRFSIDRSWVLSEPALRRRDIVQQQIHDAIISNGNCERDYVCQSFGMLTLSTKLRCADTLLARRYQCRADPFRLAATSALFDG